MPSSFRKGLLFAVGVTVFFFSVALDAARGADFEFVQLTDPHLFEKRKKNKGEDEERQRQAGENRIAFTRCIEEVNRLQTANPDKPRFQFVALTGDIGIEALNATNLWADAVTQTATMLRASKIKMWLFVPGNNDLTDERPETVTNYQRFIADLQTRLQADQFTLVDLCPSAPGLSHSRAVAHITGKFRFIGFNDASFKSNDSGRDALEFKDAQLECIRQVAEQLGTVKPEESAYIFYHIPEVDDPYWATSAPPAEMYQHRGEKRRAGDGVICSAWMVSDEVRRAWDAVVKNPRVAGVIAGHFHSPRRDVYRHFNWMQTPSYAVVEESKLFVCPPVACKFQTDAELQARGFRTFAINEHGDLSSEIIWHGDFRADGSIPEASALPAVSSQPVRVEVVNAPATTKLSSHCWFCIVVLVFVALVVVLAGVVVCFRCWRTARPVPARPALGKDRDSNQ